MPVDQEVAWKDLVAGIRHGDITIRLALASERRRIQELADAVVSSQPSGPLRSIYAAAGSSGRLLSALSRGRTNEIASRVRATTGIDQLIRDLSVSIVAVENGKVIGVTVVGCPFRLMVEQATTQEESALLWRFLAKLHIVSVDSAHRGRGIGGALVDVVTRLYAGLGMNAIYGECRPDLADFYAAHDYDVSAPGSPVNIRDQVVIMEFIQGDTDECTIVRRLRETDGEQITEALPWMDLGDLRATEIDFEWMFGAYPTPEGLMPTMIVSGLETAIGHLGGATGTLIARIEDDRIHLCRNDPTMSTAQSAIITCDDIGAEHALWVAAARERGKCTLHLVKQLPRTQMEVNAVTATDGLLIDARIESGWESLDTVAALLGHHPRPGTTDSATGSTVDTPPKPPRLFRRLRGR